MSRERIRWIVVLMAIGLLGLVGFQLYWISNALHLQREQFAYKVTDALQEVVRTLERQEAVYLTRQRLQAQQQQHRLREIGRGRPSRPAKDIRSTDRLLTQAAPVVKRPKVAVSANRQGSVVSTERRRKLMPNPAMTTPTDMLHPTPQPLTPEQQQVIEAFFRQQNELMVIGDWQTQLAQQEEFDQWVDQVLVRQLTAMNDQMRVEPAPSDSLNRAKALRLKRLRARRLVENAEASVGKTSATPGVKTAKSRLATEPKTEEQSRIIKDMLKGLLLSDRPIGERVNRMTLDTLLRQALQERGVTIGFDYGVQTSQLTSTDPMGLRGSRFLFASHGVNADQFARDGYKAALFPNNIMETGNYVHVYFPDQQQFIWGRMGLTLAGSAVLILVIMACFYVAISTIVRQKKLADIKNDFINNMTHEFKTPISTISLAVEMAQEQLKGRLVPVVGTAVSDSDFTPPDPRLTRYLGIVRDEVRRLGSHVEKVLQMAMLDKGEIKLKLSLVNVHDTIGNVLNNIGLQIEQRGGEIDLAFDAENEIVEADELHLTNILYNLVDNAIKYSPDQPHLTIQTRSLPTGVSISVSDRGVGMTREQMSRIFETFYRVPTGNRHDVKGFGLGLSYVKKMIDEHHGQIRVESRLGKGSTFEIILPYTMSGSANE
ncbi:MAG: HAMP domain-containing histidine kinase [Bacteroidetes bacterium]|nr:HAMP domain-containing histidine kinase [Fibrella sp.]